MEKQRTSNYKNTETIHGKYEVSYFIGHGSEDEVTCFYSSNTKYIDGNQYSIFDIPSLLNRLALSSKVIPYNVFEQANYSKEDIVIVEQWDLFSKKIILLKPKKADFGKTSKNEYKLLKRDYSNKFFQRNF